MLDSRKFRTIGVTYLAIFIFLVALWNGLRVGEAIFFWKTIKEYGASPLYISASGGSWCILGLFLVWGLWQGKSWGRVMAICGTVLYTAWYWFNRLVLQQPRANWPFVLITNIILLVLIFSILFSKRTRLFFKKVGHERQPKTQTTS